MYDGACLSVCAPENTAKAKVKTCFLSSLLPSSLVVVVVVFSHISRRQNYECISLNNQPTNQIASQPVLAAALYSAIKNKVKFLELEFAKLKGARVFFAYLNTKTLRGYL